MEFSGDVLRGFLYVTTLGGGSEPAGTLLGSAMVKAWNADYYCTTEKGLSRSNIIARRTMSEFSEFTVG
jgi:hypothetical protein